MPHITVALTRELAGEVQSIEYAWVGDQQSTETIVFLHEGLGSLSAWGGFPHRLCQTLCIRGLVYSRSGFGRSLSNRPKFGLPVDYHLNEALQTLPHLLDALNIQSCYLFGHSDGATIALLAAANTGASRYHGLVLLAPHIFVETATLSGIRGARLAYETGSLKDKISRHHLDVDAVFYNWNDVWLSAEFQDWNIEEQLSSIQVPTLVMQGANDEYATSAQLDGIARQVRNAQVVEIPDCRHYPHREAESIVVFATKALLAQQAALTKS